MSNERIQGWLWLALVCLIVVGTGFVTYWSSKPKHIEGKPSDVVCARMDYAKYAKNSCWHQGSGAPFP